MWLFSCSAPCTNMRMPFRLIVAVSGWSSFCALVCCSSTTSISFLMTSLTRNCNFSSPLSVKWLQPLTFSEVNDMVLGFEVVPPKETSRLPSGASRILSDQQSTRTSWLSCLRNLAIRSEAIAERSLRRRIRRLAWAGSFLHARRPRGCDVQRDASMNG